MKRKEQLKLDQLLRLLFKLSKRSTIDLINGLFGDSFAYEDVPSIHYSNVEMIADDLSRLIGDFHVKLVTTKGTYRYHVEFQTLNDQSMAIRMFRYGFEMALEKAATDDKGDASTQDPRLPLIVFPRQVVVFLEENDAIGESVAFRLQLPDGQEVVYEVPAVRYWQWSLQDLRKSRMYALLPLQVFKSRKQIRSIADSRKPEEEKRRLIERCFADLKEVVRQTVAMIAELHDQEVLPTRDMDRLIRAMSTILNYLYRKYGEPYHQTEKEVFVLIKSFYDPEIRKQAREEGKKIGLEEGRLEGRLESKLLVAQRMLSLNIDLQLIVQATELSVEEVERLRHVDNNGSEE
ncbi:RpnC/YadD family protein [Cohnella fermenti]|uniref:Transposase n=1 Tax=Cohnella fermenti TaxID=2565925 RepID=A0A4S4C4L8_9BACL|nr:hypothetical protein [Cohnella fermenti]THF82747.1 hypothetical protein E6C55_06715 [Cohnella fermenti]